MLPKGGFITPKWAWLWSVTVLKFCVCRDTMRRADSSATAELLVLPDLSTLSFYCSRKFSKRVEGAYRQIGKISSSSSSYFLFTQ